MFSAQLDVADVAVYEKHSNATAAGLTLSCADIRSR